MCSPRVGRRSPCGVVEGGARHARDGSRRTGRRCPPRPSHSIAPGACIAAVAAGKCPARMRCTVAGRAAQCFGIDCPPFLTTTGALPWPTQQSRKTSVHSNDSLHASPPVSLRHGHSGELGWNRFSNTAVRRHLNACISSASSPLFSCSSAEPASPPPLEHGGWRNGRRFARSVGCGRSRRPPSATRMPAVTARARTRMRQCLIQESGADHVAHRA
ncbi:uncharacterized protein BCN122_III0381 [Burkholderia cenocepacia]|nr:uncharacterized protein BCN122_III0381 [Burkholderia cenocepacia]